MSSMFKKKGGLAFKPKIPSARPRGPSALKQSTQPPKPVESRAPSETVPEEPIAHIEENEASGSIASEYRRPSSVEPAAAAPTQPQENVETEVPLSDTRRSPAAVERLSGSEHIPAVPTELPTEELDEVTPPQVDQKQPSPELQLSVQAPVRVPVVSIEPVEEPPTAPVEGAPTSQPQPSPSLAAATASSTSRPTTRRSASTTHQAKDGETADSIAPKRKRRRTNATDSTEEQPPSSRKRRSKGESSTPAPRRARSVTPEDAESQMVDLQKLKMSDLTRDLHIGKKFSRHDELRDRERQARIKAKLEKDGIEVDKDGDGDDASTSANVKPGSGAPAAPAPAAPRPAAGGAATGPQFRIVDGQSSLVMDRHARAVATQQDMETIEENDFTRLITSSSFMNNSKLRGPNIWSAEETELFYHALRTFGTDFEMISKMFPGKQRRHIKLKFNREERHSPALIDAALIGEKTSKMDIDEYKAYTGSEFESVESIEAEQRKIQEGFEAEQKRLADEQAEIMRKKREELFADDDNTNDQSRRKKGNKKKGKDPLQYGIEVEA
jgi:transcription factor TFIIIB component B''